MPFYQVQCGGNVIMMSDMQAARRKADRLASKSGVKAMVLECDVVYMTGMEDGRRAAGDAALRVVDCREGGDR